MDASVQALAPVLQPQPQAAKSPQQWELLASPGHVLLAQVDVLRHKVREPLILGAVGIGLIVASIFVAPYLGRAAGALVGGIDSAWRAVRPSKAPAANPAPALRPLAPVLDAGLRLDPAEVASLADVTQALEAQVTAAKAGQRMSEGCLFDKQITATWAAAGDTTPRCRYSADGSRLWVWGVAKPSPYSLAAVAALIRQDSAGAVTLHSVGLPGAARLPGKPSLDPALVPRAIAADFPELVTQ